MKPEGSAFSCQSDMCRVVTFLGWPSAVNAVCPACGMLTDVKAGD